MGSPSTRSSASLGSALDSVAAIGASNTEEEILVFQQKRRRQKSSEKEVERVKKQRKRGLKEGFEA